MTTISESWNAIDAWLRSHAPATAAMLASPAEPEQIAAAEETLGLSFHPELVESLRRHNGVQDSANVLPMGVPLSLDEIVEHRQMLMKTAVDVGGLVPRGDDAEPWWHELWLPFAHEDGDYQVIDLRPGLGYGRLGWRRNTEEGKFENSGDPHEPRYALVAWPTLSAYLSEVADVLDHGGDVAGWRPLVEDDEMWWE